MCVCVCVIFPYCWHLFQEASWDRGKTNKCWICIWRYYTGARASLYWDWIRCWLHKYHYLPVLALTISSTLLRTEASQWQCQGNCWRLPVILEKRHRTLHARWLLMKVMKVPAWKWSPIPYLVLLSFFLFWMHKRVQTQPFSMLVTQNTHCPFFF